MAFGFGQIIRVQRTQQEITGDTQVETVDKVNEELFTIHTVEERVHGDDGRRYTLLTVSRP